VVSTLKRHGFSQVRSRGSHVVMARPKPEGGRIVCVVPLHKELALGTLRGILRQAELSPDAFLAKL
jgi:predicted RNA binding protein YcfA (HicA-like mRNA interferase family)